MTGPTERRVQLKGHQQKPAAAAPVELPVRRRPRYARWRALSLSLVYVIFAIHIVHWKVSGTTLAPLELNEVMYTLELGIITAGFLFMCALALGTLIFGRFFCSWACHIMVLQDFCAWLLRKLKIRPAPIRSRVLLWVPPLTACYMFIWPQVVRAWDSRALPTFHFATDRDGWASFVTENFWRNLPSAPVIILTFLVCGFFIVYLMGSRSFCTYVCPYGAIFALADRFSPSRIQLAGDCKQCGTCTGACTSGVRVHEEIKLHGLVVNSACLKDLDCVSACPQQALRYGFGRPKLFKAETGIGRFGVPYTFTRSEDALMAVVFLVVVLSFRGLYSRVPFLLSLALGGIIAYLSVVGVRMLLQPQVRLATLDLKSGGRWSRAGWLFSGATVLLFALVGHSAVIRYHEYSGLRLAERLGGELDSPDIVLAQRAVAHLTAADRWGLMHNERVERRLISAGLQASRHDTVDEYAVRLLRRYPYDAGVRLQLARSHLLRGDLASTERELRTIVGAWSIDPERAPPAVAAAHQMLGGLLARRGDFPAAAVEFGQALRLDPDSATAHAEFGGLLAEIGRLEEAVGHLRTATELDPSEGRVHYNLGTLLGHMGRFEEAIPAYLNAIKLLEADADLENNLGFALLQTGELEPAESHLRAAIAVDPTHAGAHFNLGRVLLEQGDVQAAAAELERAAELDPRFAALLGTGP